MNKQIIANDLTEIYIDNYLLLEKKQYKRNYNLGEITSYYLSMYKQILKILINEVIFNNQINLLAYKASIIYIKNNIKENFCYDINVYTKEFIETYKCILKEIGKDYILKELLKESIKDSKENIQTKIYKK